MTEQSESDEIRIEELELEARIGVPDAERVHLQRIVLSIAMKTPHGFRELNDDLRKTVDYAAVANEAKQFVSKRVVKLIETLADELAMHLLRLFDLAEVSVEIRKFVLPQTKYVAVRVTRTRPDSG